MTLGRRAEVEVTWESVGISEDIAPYLLGLSYTDNLSGAADDLTLELEDRDGLWSGAWQPDFGDTVEARLRAEPWLTTVEDLRLGLFAHDKASFTGPPKKVSLKCVSAPLATGLRRARKTRAWSGVTLQQMAQDIATASGLALLWDGPAGLTYPRREQKDQSDLEFLQQACEERGLALKVTEGQIAIFEEHTREQAASIGAIDLAGGHVISWSFESQDHERYGRCRVKCYDPKAGRTIEGEYRDPDDDGPTLEVTRNVSSIAEAEEVAQALLRQSNRWASTGSLVLQGDPGLVAGVTFDLTGAYGFEGKFIVTKAAMKVGGGYTCSLDVRRCLEAY